LGGTAHHGSLLMISRMAPSRVFGWFNYNVHVRRCQA
jgi:hypothetical protein